jgi:hypothetical protein
MTDLGETRLHPQCGSPTHRIATQAHLREFRGRLQADAYAGYRGTGQASEQTLMSIAGHLSRKMLEHYSHIRMAAKRLALDAIAKPVSEAGMVQNPLHSLPTQESAVTN